jgi:hypothetical protein
MESEGILCTFNGVHTVYQDAFQLITEDVFITILDTWANTCYPGMNGECIVSPVERINDFVTHVTCNTFLILKYRTFEGNANAKTI